MSEFESHQSQDLESEAGAPPAKVPLTARLLLRESLTARRAAAIIPAFTSVITVVGGIFERVLTVRSYRRSARGCGSRCRP